MTKKPHLIPQPVRLHWNEGTFTFSPRVALVAGGAALEIARYFARSLAPATGFTINPQPEPPGSKRRLIAFQLDDSLERLGKEGYRLVVSSRQIDLRAWQPAGLFYAVQTLRQLMNPQVFSMQPVQKTAWRIPCVEIEDTPRFGWRGAMLDVSRHFFPKEFVLRFIDLLALHKLNSFHWHLTDDQGWRIEIRRYPRLTEVGAWRKETMIGHGHDKPIQYDGIPHGGFYTQDEIREVVAYAQERFINVVPEIEMPGHAQAAIAAYPELGNTGKQVEVCRGWGIITDVYNVEESTIQFMQNVLEEVLELFPSPFIHVGGDEVPKDQWKASPRAQARKQELGLKDEEELQSYFIGRMDSFLTAKGRRLVGWTEILEGGLAPGATVMAWLGEKGALAAINARHDVIMAPYETTYLDYYQSENRKKEPLAIGNCTPLAKVYNYEPVPASVKPEDAHYILGTQAQLWTEYIPTTQHVEYMAFPRLCALAEVAWSPAAAKDFKDFSERIKTHVKRLGQLKVNYRPL